MPAFQRQRSQKSDKDFFKKWISAEAAANPMGGILKNKSNSLVTKHSIQKNYKNYNMTGAGNKQR